MNNSDWIHKYRVVRRLIVVWAMWLITYSMFQYFGLAESGLHHGTESVVISVIGLLTVAAGVLERKQK